MCMVVDVTTTESDVIACFISFLLADVVANISPISTFIRTVITQSPQNTV